MRARCAARRNLRGALLGRAREPAPGAARLFSEAGDAAGGRPFLLLGRRAEVGLRQRADDHDLVVLDGDLHSLEPAVWEPSGKPTLDRTELFLIHVLHNYTVINEKSSSSSPFMGKYPAKPGDGAESPADGGAVP